LRTRLLGLVLLAILPAFALIGYLNLEGRAEKRQQAYEEAMRVVRFAVGEQSRLVENTRYLLLGISRAPEVRTLRPAGCAAILRGLLPQFPSYANLGVSGADGAVVCSATALAGPVTFADRPWFRRSPGPGV
jgi:hypothetical protein